MNENITISFVVLSFFGCVGNLVSIGVCLRKELRRIPTFVFMAFLSAINILKLTTIALCLIASQYLVDKFHQLDSISLKLIIFLIFWEYQSSAYFKVFKIFFFFELLYKFIILK